MQLAEQGRLDLGTDIATYLDYALPARLERHPYRGGPGPVTLAHLLTHTAGFEGARSGGYGEPLTLFHALLDAIFPDTTAGPPVQAAGAAERSRAFVGEYHANRRSYSSDESLLGLMEAMRIGVDADGFLGVSVLGEATRFAEVAPGVNTALREGHSAFPYRALNTLVFHTDANGRTMLFTDGKVSYEAAPWYRTTGLNLLAIGGRALLCLLTLVGWALASVPRAMRRHRAPQPTVAQDTRWTAGVLAGSVLVSLLGVVSIAGSVDPILGQPLAAFGAQPAWSPLLLVPEALLIVTGLALTPLAIIVWRRRLWGVLARLHTTLLAALALAPLAALAFRNLLF